MVGMAHMGAHGGPRKGLGRGEGLGARRRNTRAMQVFELLLCVASVGGSAMVLGRVFRVAA